MSKIGEKPVSIPEGVKVVIEGKTLTSGGPLGEMKISLPREIEAEIIDNCVKVKRSSDSLRAKALHGTFARLIGNAITGVAKGFEKSLEIVGTGYRGQMENKDLVLSLGFSHQIRFPSPEGITLSVVENKIKVFGINKEKVGDTAYKIKMFRKPDPYKGKGIRYFGEKLKLKPGKAAAKATGAPK